MRYPLKSIDVGTPFSKTHFGVDFRWSNEWEGKNAPVYAVDNGTVIYIEKQKSGGNVIHIRHENGYVSEYGHLEDNSIRVKKGMNVLKGEWIANMGGTGKVSGNHLHFGLYKGRYINYNDRSKFVDPLKYLCLYYDQRVSNMTDRKYLIYKTKIAHDIPETEIGEAMYIRYKNTKIVGKIYNGQEVETYGAWKVNTRLMLVDNIREYTALRRFL